MKRQTAHPCPLPALVIAAACAVISLCRAAEQVTTNAAVPPTAATVLTTAEQVHQLSRETAALGLPAVLRGVVTCSLPDSGGLVLQDATRGIYVDQAAGLLPVPPRIGDLLEVEGVTDPGQFAPQVHARRLTRLGEGELPTPAHPTWDQLINGSFDTQFVEMEGIITDVRADSVVLLTHGGKLKANLFNAIGPSNRVALARLEDSRVRLRGCLFAMWDAQTHQVRVGEITMYYPILSVSEPAPKDVFALPRKRASELRLFDPQASALQRVRVSGEVVHEHEGEFFAMDGTNGFRFIPKGVTSFAAGDLVEVVGFPSLTGPCPVLREAVARTTGAAELPRAIPLDPEDFFRPGYDAKRVRIDAVLQGLSADQRTLELQSGLQRFLARLTGAGRHHPPRPAPPAEQAAQALGIPVGSRLELTGVYAGRGGNPATGGEIGSFELLVDSPADILVLARPPFWTLPRLLVLVGALVAVLMLALFWIRLLHHEVQTRTAQLRVEVREREHAEQQRALATERSRIARDLHDDLGSSLTEITLLATAGPGQEVTPQEASERLETIAGKSRIMVHALDEIVWAADPERDTLSSLARYLASYAEEYLAGLKVACRVQIPHVFPERLVSGEVRHELFLAVKEALNNAVRHGHAAEVGFRVRLAGDRMEISVRDNGDGFDLASHPSGHGLLNLRTRLENMQGRCDIQSSPGGGTSVSLEVPLNSPYSKT